MDEDRPKEERGTRPEPEEPAGSTEKSIAIHIFTASAALVGVCLTVISIVRSFPAIQSSGPWIDDLLAINATAFLTCCMLSYFTLRTRNPKRMHRIESIADLLFLAGLSSMVAVCAYIVWAIA